MPDVDRILRGLSRIANEFAVLALAWHLVVIVAIAALALGARPSRRTAALLLVAPFASVSALAWMTGNPFNGITFATAGVALTGIGLRLPRDPITLAAPRTIAAGSLALVYAWLYPHFLDSPHPAMYLVAAPMGLLPCPTLSMVLGFGLLAGGLGSRAWALVTAGVGVFYSLFGMLRLGVWLDIGLLAAAMAMLMASERREGRALREKLL